MSEYNRLVAGENISIEKKERETVIHCTAGAAPLKNQYSGFFQIKNVPEGDNLQRPVISNCIFRLNGKYQKIEDYVIHSFYHRYSFVYLNIAHSRIDRFVYEDDRRQEGFDYLLENPHLVLLYVLSYRNYRLSIESFAAGGMIDAIYGGEGFVYQLKDGSINTTFTRTVWGDRNEFDSASGVVYIPCYNPATGEGLNIYVPGNTGGVLEVGRGDNYYRWAATGYPSGFSAEAVTVKIRDGEVYF